MESEAAQAAGSGGPLTSVPWSQIPKFIPGETDVKVYGRKLEFLRELWPADYLDQLAPRAALLVEGVAFQKVSRMDPAKLKSKDGVRHLVEALGGAWGRLASEERYDMFEKALYMTVQKADESNDSYLARHDAAFEDLMSAKVSLEEVRAYILVRQSLLQSEDRKKVILDSEGALTYEMARKSMRLLGSRFFQDLQVNSKTNTKYKTYDVHQADEEPILYQEAEEDVDEEVIFQSLLDSGDEDAVFVNEFEEAILTACQESAELAPCFASYQEARQKLRDKAKSRGFWPLGAGKGRNKGKKGKFGNQLKGTMGNNQSAAFRRRSLADRIANSTCRRCGQPGHWKRECPMTAASTSGSNLGAMSKKSYETESFTGVLHEEDEGESQSRGFDVVDVLPHEAVVYEEDRVSLGTGGSEALEMLDMGDQDVGCSGQVVCECFMSVSKLSQSLSSRLTMCCRNRDVRSSSAAAEIAPPSSLQQRDSPQAVVQVSPDSVDIFTTEEADDEAIIDTGASRTVIGSERLKRLVSSLPSDLKSRVMKVPSEGVVFKFGNAGRLSSNFAVMLPRSQNGWLRVEVVPGQTPFLISNAVLRGLRGIVDVEGCLLGFRGSQVSIPLVPVRKNLMGIKIVDLLRKAPQMSASPTHILSAHTDEMKRETTDDDQWKRQTQTKHETERASKTHRMHEAQKQGRIQVDVLPKEGVNVSQGLNSHQSVTTTSAAVEGHQACTESGVGCSQGPKPHGQQQNVQLPGSSAHDADRSESPGEPDAQRVSHGFDKATRHEHSDGLGAQQSAIGKACQSDLCGPLRERPRLCESAMESQSCLNMGEEFPALLQGTSSGKPRTSKKISPGGGQASDSTSSDDLDAQDRAAEEVNDSSAHDGEPAEGSPVIEPAELGRGMDQHSSRDSPSRRRQGGQTQSGVCGETAHGGATECREGVTAEGTDCHPSARARQGDPGSSSKFTVNRVEPLHDQIHQLSTKIEQGLSTLKCDDVYLSHEKILKVNRRYVKVSSGKQLGEPSKSYNKIHLLEVYCNEGSQLTSQMVRMGGTSLRFTRRDGDLSTKEGRDKLWTWVYMYEPEHLWVAPECKFWGNFSRYNMGRSYQTCETILQGRAADGPHLVLCNQLYLHQVSHSRHFHLEQPRGSEMIMQKELNDARLGTLPATIDMCQVGKLRLPETNHFLQKRTQIFTTSRTVFQTLHGQTCEGQHAHVPIKGQFKHLGKWQSISSHAQTYTTLFARRVVAVLLWECQHPEVPLILGELILGLEEHERPEMAQESLQLKRRRVELKQPETSLYGKAPSWKDIFRTVGYSTPRVGNACFHDRDDVVVKLVQQVVPEIKVELVVACRGTDRHRIQPANVVSEVLPWRKTVVVDRGTGEVRDLGPPEAWTQLSRLQQIRTTGPAKMSLSIFGRKDDINEPFGAIFKETGQAEKKETGMSQQVPELTPMDDVEHPAESQKGALNTVPTSHLLESKPMAVDQDGLSRSGEQTEGWAPRITPKSGPAFVSLGANERAELRRLHNNLGHPDPQKMAKFLTERGAKPEIIAGARDMCCDTCVETQSRPKKSQPGKIHDDRDFNDLVGADGAYWTNASGKTFHFMHFIDEATLYHVGGLSARKVEDQIQTFLNIWVQWAGPCKTLYLDPAGEYVNETWAAMLQGEGIQVSMTAAESHWQNGRAESHGRIVKGMLTRMEKERPIETAEEFTQCLRHAFSAKNSLSRVHGFTPEQCLLGKSRHLPGSLISDSNASSHCLAESELPEGIRFRENLLRRELARKAFVQADNDSAFRRALLRQSRPGRLEYDAGDWVLYWRSSRGNNRLERGRWHGPAQIIANQSPRVVWLSHLGRLIRASPEQLRPASLREFAHLPRDADGKVRGEQPRGRGYVELDGLPGDFDVSPNLVERGPVSEFSYTPTTPMESQPEGEMFPQEPSRSGNDDGSNPIESDLEVPENDPENVGGIPESDGRYVPIPDEGDDELLFGDDCGNSRENDLLWELQLLDHEYETETAALFCSEPSAFEQICLATNERKKRVELDYRKMSFQDQKLFDAAKQKEVKAWLDHGTVKKLSKGSLKPEQVMRCRWLLTWKDPLPGTTEKRAKARLVILGFEDPGVGVVPNDAPTLSKDARQLLLQKASSNRWDLLNFDISTAFLKGAGDGRPLGIHAPPEIKSALKMTEGDQCSLEGGAYGRVDAPFLWYQAFRTTLESLGFVVCPFDGCLFSLVTKGNHDNPRVRGVLGIHVDDGIGAGDSYFKSVIQKLRGIYDFGAYYEKEFDFCGVHHKQWDDGSIEMDQVGYIQKIDPIEVARSRRSQPEAAVTEMERQHLRRLCGSLQYAAVHTRPDLAAKTGQLQSMVTRATVKHLLEANRVLYEGKRYPVCLMMVPIPEELVAFCAFSDASFSSSKDLTSRQGTLIFATDVKLAKNQRTVMCPIAWSSRRIPRVVTSTLSAESIALSSSLDRLGYLRVCWEWLKNPAIDWSDPSQILRKAPTASAVTDCKSVFDIATKNATPVCSEYRTTLECLLIRERLQENVTMRWISTQAMLADCLTKSMDAGMLRECLRSGQYALFDEKESLRLRASKREKLQWLRDGSTAAGMDEA